MAGMLEYKCPCCDGAIQFDSATQKMKCPYCDTEFDVDTLKGYDEELKDEKPSEMEWATPGGSWAEGETAGLHTYSCKSCGGEIVGDDTMAASACPFCGNPIVLTGQFAGALRPDLIIPFKLDKKAAKAKLQEHLKGKTLLPRVFRSQNHIDEIKGVYVPFWLYDSDADAQLRFTATRTRFWSDDDYDYTETSYYSVRRDGVLLLISTGDRKWHISTCGYGITAFTDAGIQYLGEQMTPFMADGDYAGAFRTFVQWSDTYIDAARAGHPYDVNNLPREPLSLMYLFLALGIGLVLAWVVVSVMKSQLRSVAFQENAASYVREGSMNLTNSRELFLYRDVHRTERPKESSSRDSGGSSTHTSSSGTTHGGGGGSF